MRVLRVYHSAVVAPWRQRDRELIALGIDHAVVSSTAWNEGGRVVRLDPAGDTFVIGARTVGRHPFLFLYDPRPIWRALRGTPIDVLDIHEEPASLAVAEVMALAWLARRRPAICLYSAQNIEKRYPVPFRWLERFALRRATAIHTCNEAAGEILRGKGFSGTLCNLGLGVDTDRFRPHGDPSTPADPAQPPPIEDQLRVGYVGRLEAHKGVGVLIDAVAAVPELRLDIVGDGPDRDDLARMIASRAIGDRIKIHGFSSHADLPRTYQSFDVLAVPSLETPAWIEQFGRVAVEAMASGVVVVASDSGSLPEVIGDTGVLVPPGDAAALAETLRALHHEAPRRRRLAVAARVRAERYSWPAIAERQAGLYAGMVS